MGQIITKDMTMAEIIQKLPEAADIMQSYGLHCMECFVNMFESLEQGVLGHGMSEEVMNNLLSDLNNLADETKKESVALTELAAEKLKELLHKEGKDEYGIRIKIVKDNMNQRYEMDFERVKQDNDKVIKIHGVKLFIDSETFDMLRGITISYIETDKGAGFKFG